MKPSDMIFMQLPSGFVQNAPFWKLSKNAIGPEDWPPDIFAGRHLVSHLGIVQLYALPGVPIKRRK